jgi:Aldo/keto reductase family
MTKENKLGGTFRFPGISTSVHRMGYGAMQLAGRDGDKLVWGPPKDVDGAVAVLREAVASGVNHIDTSDYYGPHVTNQIIKRALHPYPADLVIVTKVGARRGADGSWIPAFSREELSGAVDDNLRNLGVDRLDVVNLRVGGVMAPTSHRAQQCHAAAIPGGAENHGDRWRAEFLQRGATERRCIHRCSSAAGHSIRAVFPAGRIYAATDIRTRPGRGVFAGHSNAGCAGLAAAAFS